jgi:hypothetical protein
VAGFNRNGWPTSVGIGGRIASESLAALRRITHPFPGIQIKAWAMVNGSQMGVYLTGTRVESVDAVIGCIKHEKQYLVDNLPPGTRFDLDGDWPIVLKQTGARSDTERYDWLKGTLNSFVNVLRPRLKEWHSL